ncbi:hypothetical protein JCM11251_001102 [Rhodosporidiobolus azoricus]
MVRRIVSVLALAAIAVAASPDFSSLEALVKRQADHLTKRQSDGTAEQLEQVQGLLNLAQSVIADYSSGNLSAACTEWTNGIVGCQNGGASDYQVAVCACGADVLDDMSSCASGYGSEGEANASGFNTFCSTTLPALPDNSTVSSAFSSAAASATSAISAISSAASSASSTSAAASSASSGAATGGGNGASKVVGAGGVAGLLAAVAALAL